MPKTKGAALPRLTSEGASFDEIPAGPLLEASTLTCGLSNESQHNCVEEEYLHHEDVELHTHARGFIQDVNRTVEAPMITVPGTSRLRQEPCPTKTATSELTLSVGSGLGVTPNHKATSLKPPNTFNCKPRRTNRRLKPPRSWPNLDLH